MKRTSGKRFVIALSLSIALLLTGCGQRAPQRFKVVEQFEGGVVWVDTETGIGYAQLYGAGSVFPLYDKDGELYRPNGWRDYGE